MQTLTKFERSKTDGSQSSFDQIAVKAQKAARFIAGMAMICVKSLLSRKWSLADSAFVFLENEKIGNEFRRKTSSQQSPILVPLHLQSWRHFESLLQSLIGSPLGFIGSRVLPSGLNAIRARVNLLARSFALWFGSVLGLPFAQARRAFGRSGSNRFTRKHLFSVCLVVLSPILAMALWISRIARSSRFLHSFAIPFNPEFLVGESFGDVDRPLLRGAFRFSFCHPFTLSHLLNGIT